MKFWNEIGRALWSVNEGIGRLGWVIVLYIMTFGVADVTLRYLFNRPSDWIFLSHQFAMVILVTLAAGYSVQHGKFIRLELLYGRLSPQKKAIFDIITFLAFTSLYCIVLIWKGIETANFATAMRQVTAISVRWPIYPLKFLIPLGALLLMFVTLKKFVYDIKIAFGKGTGRAERKPSSITVD